MLRVVVAPRCKFFGTIAFDDQNANDLWRENYLDPASTKLRFRGKGEKQVRREQ